MVFSNLDDPRRWIDHIFPTLDSSPLYKSLKQDLIDDPELASLLMLVDKDQPLLTLFFTAVNYLVFKYPQEGLAQFYPYLNQHPRDPADAYPFFKAFCTAHRSELKQLLPSVRMQTNEVTRCANLLPAFCLVYERERGKPLDMIEIGTSAGLNLNWFRFGYVYQNTLAVGDQFSPVQISCALPEHHFPALKGIPEVAVCQGIDLSPLSIGNDNDVLWLRAHIWPEEQWRYDLLDAAIQFTRLHPPRLYGGDATRLLPNLLAAAPLDHTLCIWHSFALNQGKAQVKAQIEGQLLNASRTRTIYRVSLEVDPARKAPPRLELFTYQKGASLHEALAECAYHGESMVWLAPA